VCLFLVYLQYCLLSYLLISFIDYYNYLPYHLFLLSLYYTLFCQFSVHFFIYLSIVYFILLFMFTYLGRSYLPFPCCAAGAFRTMTYNITSSHEYHTYTMLYAINAQEAAAIAPPVAAALTTYRYPIPSHIYLIGSIVFLHCSFTF
jgi:hypothetical protein